MSVAGLVLALSALPILWRSPDDGTSGHGRISRWLPATLTIAAAAACGALLTAPPGPGGSGIVGGTGVTVDANGAPIIVLVVCERSIDSVTFYGPYRGGPNEKLGVLTASGPVTGTVLLPVTDPPAGWSGGPVDLPLKQRPADLVIVEGHGDQSLLSQVTFTAAQLAALRPSQVLLAQGSTAPFVRGHEKVPGGGQVRSPVLAG